MFGCCYLVDLLRWLFSSLDCSLVFVLIGFDLSDCCGLCCWWVCLLWFWNGFVCLYFGLNNAGSLFLLVVGLDCGYCCLLWVGWFVFVW